MTASAERPTTAGRTLAVAATGTLLVLVAFTTPLATLPATAAGVHAGAGAQAWILSGMSVGCAAGLLGSGALGDDYGRRRTFLAGALVLVGGSLLGAVAADALLLVLARIVQGLGGAAIVACSLGLIGHAYPEGPERARATGIWGAALGAGVAAGPFLALGLQATTGWRSAYAMTALLAAGLALAGRAVLVESRAASPRPVDAAGTILLALGVSALLAGLVEGRSGWTRPATLALLLLGGVLVAGFAAVEHCGRYPMLDLGLLRRPDFVGALFAALTPLSARWLSSRVAPRTQLVAGLLGCAAGQLALLGLHPGDPVVRLLPGLLVAGAANGVLNAALGRQAVSSVPADRAAMGSGANNTARYVGSAFGLAVVTLSVTGSDPDPAAVLHGWNTAVLLTAAFSIAGALVVSLARERATTREPEAVAA
ncbi:MFS transporter [Actinoplanes sp. CA-030573]|uniref:MFS transporter n=1 Tax=Actinoplanes sp. CA-030573 TaxID=3239898 RepID=UPI003D944D1E